MSHRRFASRCITLTFAILLSACAHKTVRDTPRTPATQLSPTLQRALAEFRAADPDASFSFVDGHVDSFATSAKAHIPDYALPILRQFGLPETARPVTRLLDPVRQPKPRRDLDQSSQMLPFVPEQGTDSSSDSGKPDEQDRLVEGKLPNVEVRDQPAELPDRMIDWQRPDPKTLTLERGAALPILQAFLARHAQLFEIDQAEVGRSLLPVNYQVAPYFRRATFDQLIDDKHKLLYGRTLVHFDLNWNVIGVSRMLVTAAKLRLRGETTTAISQDNAQRIGSNSPPSKQCAAGKTRTVRAEQAVDMIRRIRVWDVEQISLDGECHWRTIIDAASGRVLNVSDLIDRAFTDAQVNRWFFSGGDLFNAQQIVSTGQYTRNDRRLEHDFFYMMNDHRCEGDAETTCNGLGFSNTQCERAHGSTNGSSFVRATRRTNRDFNSYFPGGASETFAETHAYYWARQFAQWLKPSLDAMGVLPDSASDFARVLIVADACRSGSVHNSSYDITTEDNKGEGTNVIRLAHRNPSGSSNHNAACEGGGCFDNPSNLHHEMNHFFLKRYYDVGSDLDCGAANQLKFIHEGGLGTAVPQAFWHNYYGVGYNPSNTSQLYFSSSDIGRVHTSNSNRLTIGNALCVNSTDDPYRAGRVVAQALWEFYHGIKVTGSSTSGTWRPTTDTDFNWIVYWAADLMAASTYKDRYEFANRLMEILDKHTNWSSDGKQDYCEIFEHHELRNFINSDYCS